MVTSDYFLQALPACGLVRFLLAFPAFFEREIGMGCQHKRLAAAKEMRFLTGRGQHLGQVVKESAEGNLSLLVGGLLAIASQGSQQMTGEQSMPILLFRRAGSSGGERQADAARTRGTLPRWLPEVIAQTLPEMIEVEVRGAVGEFARVTAIEDNQYAAGLLVFKEHLAEPAQREMRILVTLEMGGIEGLRHQIDLILVGINRQQVGMSTEEKEREIAFLQALGQVQQRRSDLFGGGFLAEQRGTDQLEATAFLLQDRRHSLRVVDRVLQRGATGRGRSVDADDQRPFSASRFLFVLLRCGGHARRTLLSRHRAGYCACHPVQSTGARQRSNYADGSFCLPILLHR